ncbi:SCAN domain-containing protein 3-like [Aphis craccivora]|uniref:SCAN domain-containing protein 3-like n=1 Tax=Aphis craccivora TaxID=307492 RepID=A0A6G0ZGL8_APHCR|nr:SCAN domain-containing protein 3-like [Aphis craccivora]
MYYNLSASFPIKKVTFYTSKEIDLRQMKSYTYPMTEYLINIICILQAKCITGQRLLHTILTYYTNFKTINKFRIIIIIIKYLWNNKANLHIIWRDLNNKKYTFYEHINKVVKSITMKDNFYEIGTVKGKLQQLNSRNQYTTNKKKKNYRLKTYKLSGNSISSLEIVRPFYNLGGPGIGVPTLFAPSSYLRFTLPDQDHIGRNVFFVLKDCVANYQFYEQLSLIIIALRRNIPLIGSY